MGRRMGRGMRREITRCDRCGSAWLGDHVHSIIFLAWPSERRKTGDPWIDRVNKSIIGYS